MSKNDERSSLDYTNAITDVHNEDSSALDVINVNSLVPERFGRIEFTYVTSGAASGEISSARYYSNGAYQETRLVARGDSVGSAHKTTINFINRTPASLAGKSFVVYDNGGAVNVWFNVDFAYSAPVVPGTYRNIAVNLLSSHDSETIANKVALAMDIDAQFIAVYSTYYVIISSASAGVKQNSYDINTGLYLKNTAGTDPQTLNSKYFFINSALNANQYYVWYNVGGTGVNPAIPGKTGLMVSIPLGCSAQVVAQNTKTVLDATTKFITNIDSDTLIITNVLIGVTAPAQEQNTGFLVFVQRLGENRQLLATLVMSYNTQGNLSSVERL